MQKNVDDMTVNMAKAEELNDQAEMMNQNANQFRHKATDMKRQMWWKNVKVCRSAGCHAGGDSVPGMSFRGVFQH